MSAPGRSSPDMSRCLCSFLLSPTLSPDWRHRCTRKARRIIARLRRACIFGYRPRRAAYGPRQVFSWYPETQVSSKTCRPTAISAKCFLASGPAAPPWLFAGVEPAISYKFGSEQRSIADYLGHNPTTGLLIAKDDTILYEHYQYARTDRDRLLSQSMAAITSMLIGIAISEGKVKSIDDPSRPMFPALRGNMQNLNPRPPQHRALPFRSCGGRTIRGLATW